MNKYLEKIAGLIPRALSRVAKQGVGATLKESIGQGARGLRAAKANGDKNLAIRRTMYAKQDAAKAGPLKKAFGNPEAKVDQARAAAAKASLRSRRAQQASDLGAKGSRKVVGTAAAGAAAVGAAASTARKSNQD